MSVTHVAGPVVKIGDRCVQRCALCGEKLLDNLNVVAPLNADGTPPAFAVWGGRRLVCYDGNRSTDVGDFMERKILPPDFCLPLVEVESMAQLRIECTGVSATWCPICGDCTCADEADLNDDDCPLHSDESKHGTL